MSGDINNLLPELALRAKRLATEEGMTSTALECMQLFRSNQPTEITHALYEPSVCIIAQGQKQARLGEELYSYNPSTYLVAAVDLPVRGQVIEATPEQPYLCIRLGLKPHKISEMLLENRQLLRPVKMPHRGLFVSQANYQLLDAVLRLMRLLDTPDDLAVLAPLVEREILYRLLLDEQAVILQQTAQTDSHAQQITRVIKTLKHNYHKNWRIEELAQMACMSNSALHAHFKSITNMTPLQYLKQLRLQEARRLLFSENLDAATASHRVGYESPSQFNREYQRLFGLPPVRDLVRLRNTAPALIQAN
ncbi:AraC family transcriptional regulator [Cellvibrio sp. UBA7661]|uniref:AraC family transcriptional regulator n=1 Tax=Cellvibrio sp. UBA7661 TaxID=1946311 RepID=UPI002F35EE2E